MNYVPSKIELCQTDQPSFFIVLISFIFTFAGILMLLQKYFPFDAMNMDDYLSMIFLPPTTCIVLPYLFFRCSRIRALFEKGEEVLAKVTFMDNDLVPWFVIRYEFSYEDKIYKRTITIMCTKYSKNIAGKKEFIVMVDPVSKRSYIRDVFGFE